MQRKIAGDSPYSCRVFQRIGLGPRRISRNARHARHGCPFETFGLSIAEAMSCGFAGFVSDDGGANER